MIPNLKFHSKIVCAKRSILYTLLGGMPIKFIGNSFVMFYTKHLPLEFIGNYDVCEIPLKSIGKSFNIQSNYYLRRIFPKRITGESF